MSGILIVSSTKFTPEDLSSIDVFRYVQHPDLEDEYFPRDTGFRAQQGVAQGLRAGKFQFRSKSGNDLALVHKSTQEDRDRFPWQVTFFWPPGEGEYAPTARGHHECRNLHEVASVLVDNEVNIPTDDLLTSSVLTGSGEFAFGKTEEYVLQASFEGPVTQAAVPEIESNTEINFWRGVPEGSDPLAPNAMGLVFVSPSREEAELFAGQGLVPVSVRVLTDNIFDGTDPEHLARIGLEGEDPNSVRLFDSAYVENPETLKVIKDAGFDGFYVRDYPPYPRGFWNIALFGADNLRTSEAIHSIVSSREHFTPMDKNNLVCLSGTVDSLKESQWYRAAKAGDWSAAVSLLEDVLDEGSLSAMISKFHAGEVFVAPHAQELGGRNAIPVALASLCAELVGGDVDREIFQANKTYHTGAGIMDRILHPASFAGDVIEGAGYVLVDDNLTSGGTLADLGSYIQSKGGEVVGVVSLTISDRWVNLPDRSRKLGMLRGRFGHVIEDELGIKIESLTDAELSYLIGFRDADELRDRITKARQERVGRLHAKGVSGMGSSENDSLTSRRRYSLALTSASHIQSLTLQELRISEDPEFLRKRIRRAELDAPELKRVYASTVEYKTRSSKFALNHIIYTQKVLFRDFVTIARDKQIPMGDAIRYALESGDVTVNCSCPSMLYHGWRFLGTQLGYLYGLPREGRSPNIRNPALKSVYCKHLSRVVEEIMQDEMLLVEKFNSVYRPYKRYGYDELDIKGD